MRKLHVAVKTDDVLEINSEVYSLDYFYKAYRFLLPKSFLALIDVVFVTQVRCLILSKQLIILKY